MPHLGAPGIIDRKLLFQGLKSSPFGPVGWMGCNGRTKSRGPGGELLWFFQIDDKGDIQWEQIIGGKKNDWGFRIYQDTDDSWLVAPPPIPAPASNQTSGLKKQIPSSNPLLKMPHPAS